jgi:septal ring factor EnvC (AmiA/AmiB activator)
VRRLRGIRARPAALLVVALAGGLLPVAAGSASLQSRIDRARSAIGAGQGVRQGQVIGFVGCTGLCFGTHLHFEVRTHGSVVDPLGYL